jgi:hypothetical protein
MLTPEQMAEVVRPYSTVSDKIRALARYDLPRADIARFLGKRYQYIRNVLEGDKIKPLPTSSEPHRETSGVAEHPSQFDPLPGESTKIGHVYRFSVGADGTIRLPGEVLKELEIEPLTVAPAVIENGALVFLGRREALRRVHALIPPWRPGDPLWSDELIAERRREGAADEMNV